MSTRLERILVKLAQQHAPHLAPPGWDQTGDPTERLQRLARRLAGYNILVVVGELKPIHLENRDQHVHTWVRSYGQFYSLLAQGMFPSFSKISAQYADDNLPPVVVINGEATPVVHVMAGFVEPYIAVRQLQHPISELELRGLMSIVLDELEGNDLPPAIYNQLQASGAEILKTMLNSDIRHIALTAFDRPILSEIAPANAPPQNKPATGMLPSAPPTKLPEQERIKYELEHLPEDKDAPQTPTEEMFRIEIPLGKSRRSPPVPPLPDDKK